LTATAAGVLMECRILGGAIRLAVATTVINNYLSSHLSSIITQAQIDSLLETTTILVELPVDTKAAVLKVFAEGYNVLLRIALGFTVA
jgi:hypothetical protein